LPMIIKIQVTMCSKTQPVRIIATLSAFLSSLYAFAPNALHQYSHINSPF
jgi:hypothetical protein